MGNQHAENGLRERSDIGPLPKLPALEEGLDLPGDGLKIRGVK
jgi:hypothetical protein